MKKVLLIFVMIALASCCNEAKKCQNSGSATANVSIRSGLEWVDTEGKLIQAHGGGMLYDNGVYYWYGENKDTITSFPGLRTEVIGVSCYSSKDLYNWTNHGVVLPAVEDDPDHPMHTSKVAERPKVLYNDVTGKYVMWLHIDDALYQKAHVGVAVSDYPTGPFTFRESFRPLGLESRDMTLFKDDDGMAYLIFGSGWHDKVVIAELSDDYLSLTGNYTTHLHTAGPPYGREAPAMFKRKGKYYLITSGTTGWFSNPAQYDVADNINGPYTTMGDPCIGTFSEYTFFGQSTYVQKIMGLEDAYMFMADRWIATDLRHSRYLWLPIHFKDNDKIEIKWIDEWDKSYFDM